MSRISQTESGKAWEFGLAIKCADVFNCSLNFDSSRLVAQNSYYLLPQSERNRMNKAAGEVAAFLLAHDTRFSSVSDITIQPDKAGQKGDVRDLIFNTAKGEIGISAKHRHNALKHSRLSHLIDFGDSWYNKPCSKDYWNMVMPIFKDLESRRNNGELWRGLPNKIDDFYQPILEAFIQEVETKADIRKMMEYLLGKYDYYKIVKENGIVSLQSFNLYGSNVWGDKLPFPSKINTFYLDPKRAGFATMTTDKGWQVSFRIHNAKKEIEPSLKFDVQLIGSPNKMNRYQVNYG